MRRKNRRRKRRRGKGQGGERRRGKTEALLNLRGRGGEGHMEKPAHKQNRGRRGRRKEVKT
eukprot:7971218-Prorocentrum_lima.AAC.1